MQRLYSAIIMFVQLISIAVAGFAFFPLKGGTTYNKPIVFGAAISMTGKTFKEGEYVRDGYQLWFETINAAGGLNINGKRYPVRLIYYDDESCPERTAQLTKKLISEDKVDFLLGPYGSDPTKAAAAVAEHYGVPMVEANGAAESTFTQGYHYTFGILTPAKRYLYGMIDLMLVLDPLIHTVAIVGADEVFSREVSQGAVEYAQSKGMAVTDQLFYPPNSQNVYPWLQILKGKNPDLVLGVGHLQDSLLIAKQAKELDLQPKAMGFSVGPSTPQFRIHLGSDANYIFGTTQWTSSLLYVGDDIWQTPQAYTKAFKQRYPYYHDVPYHSAESTAALVAYQHAIEEARSLDRKVIRDTLAQLDFTTFYGYLKFDARGINIAKPMAVEQLHPDGKTYTVFPYVVAERKAIYPIPTREFRRDASH